MEFKHWLINEEEIINDQKIDGLDNLIQQIKKTHPDASNNLIELIKEFITKSGVPKIEISNISMALGASLHDKVIINTSVFNSSLKHILYVVFHEIAHQYQYKKHGFAEMFAYFNDEHKLEDAVKLLRKTENITDKYALAKINQIKTILQNKGENLDTSGLYGYYAHMPESMLANYIKMVKQKLKGDDVSNPEKISQTLFNIISPKKTNNNP